jgi:hypothetical protein
VAATAVDFDLITQVAANTSAPAVLVPGIPAFLHQEAGLVSIPAIRLRLHLALGVLLI